MEPADLDRLIAAAQLMAEMSDLTEDKMRRANRPLKNLSAQHELTLYWRNLVRRLSRQREQKVGAS